ncbi:Mitotic spindle-associated MMXD complex subunit MIP18 [Seminavis robusta]|uniref:Mitotic spindle-associated MMXD complex subunit MIP18 n=1 Tax=Seminavis robusta TaxID=568900 RepID=A0A9N8H9A8_9STRA|nr:Mitotic spindle-associated MMXD complex subunit MIP18 [Seminavis robusta]|eukprot:Sro112_g055640.1 Mitotic spindle-associated MMXD complex subunit MIP18 (287) ;mRNA; r:51495-52472
MMSSGGPKDNENPTIHAVEKADDHQKKRPLGWSQLNCLHVVAPPHIHKEDEEGKDDEELWLSSMDRSVLHAIVDTWEASRGEGVKLLRKAGVGIPPFTASTTASSLLVSSPPRFVPATTKTGQSTCSEKQDPKGHGRDAITADEIFDIIRSIQDPEHAGVTLEQLRVVSRAQIQVNDVMDANSNGNSNPKIDTLDLSADLSFVSVRFTPTIPHCSMATLIGLSIKVKLMRSLPKRFKIHVAIEPGTHNSELAVSKQLNDKERVAAALENAHLLGIVNKCIREGMVL